MEEFLFALIFSHQHEQFVIVDIQEINWNEYLKESLQNKPTETIYNKGKAVVFQVSSAEEHLNFGLNLLSQFYAEKKWTIGKIQEHNRLTPFRHSNAGREKRPNFKVMLIIFF